MKTVHKMHKDTETFELTAWQSIPCGRHFRFTNTECVWIRHVFKGTDMHTALCGYITGNTYNMDTRRVVPVKPVSLRNGVITYRDCTLEELQDDDE